MQLKARLSNGLLQDLSIENLSELSVKQLKELISASFGEGPVEGMRLVCKGKILQDDDANLTNYNIQELDTVYVAKAKSSTSPVKSSPTNSSGTGKTAFDPMSEMMRNPLMESMMSNPQFMRSIMQSNPQFQRMMEEMPELREAMNDPSFFTELTRASANPSLRAEMMRNQDRTLQNIESMPGGMQHLSSMFKNLDKTTSLRPSDSTEEGDKLLARQLLGSKTSPSTSGPNTEALPNPWAPRTRRVAPISPSIPLLPTSSFNSTTIPNRISPVFSPYMSMLQQRSNIANSNNEAQGILNQFSMSQSPGPISHAPEESIETRYRIQLDTLKDMGFTNEDQNKRAIVQAAGNLDSAVEIILSQTPEAFM